MLGCLLLGPVVVNAQTTITATAANNVTVAGTSNVVVDNAITLTASSDPTQVTVSIASGFQAGDVLTWGATPGGVTGNYSSATGVLTFTGTANAASYQALLRTVKISLGGASTATRNITFTVGNVLSYTNGHFYEFVPGTFHWSAAKAAAAGRTYLGMTGYLATITSAGENDFIRQKLSSDGWIGSSDDYQEINAATGTSTYANQSAAEGKWYWVTGPEKGLQFSQGNGSPSSVLGRYMNWNSGEPNNSGSNENSGEIYSSGGADPGAWNDLDGNGSSLGYVVEYGGNPGDPNLTVSTTRGITVISSITISSTPSSQTVCNGTLTNVVNTSNASGATWTMSGTGVTGIAASGSGNISGTLVNTTNAPVTLTFTVTPYYSDGTNNLTGTPATTTVIVLPTLLTNSTVAPLYSISGQEIQTVYLGYPGAPTTQTIAVTTTGGMGAGTYSYAWSKAGCSPVASLTNGLVNTSNSSTYVFTPTAADACVGMSDNISTFTINISDSHGCTSTQTKKINVVNPFTDGSNANIQICHKVAVRGGSVSQLMTVPMAQLAVHLSHGDGMGNCAMFNGLKSIPGEEIQDAQRIAVYPNPNNGMFIVELTEIKDEAEIRIADIQGRVVAQKVLTKGAIPTATFDLTSLARGMYLMMLKDGDFTYQAKVVLQ